MTSTGAYATLYSARRSLKTEGKTTHERREKVMKKRKGFTLVEIMIVVAIIALLAAIAIPNLLTARRSANNAAAKSTLQTYATALENYAIDNDGAYPADLGDAAFDDYMKATPACTTTGSSGNISGFTYHCDTIGAADYNIVAVPMTKGTSGSEAYNLTAGATITEMDCDAGACYGH